MDLKQLDYFAHVAELGSFTRASEILGIAQSALSRHVRKLEVELGQHLFVRDGRGVTPTEAGKRLLAHSRSILMQVQRAQQEVAETRSTPLGHVVIGLPHSLGRLLTVPLVREFQRDFPQAELSITEGLTSHLHEWLLHGRIDIALLHDPVPTPAVETQPLRQDDYFLLSPRKGAKAARAEIRLAELVNLPLILPRRPHPLRMLLESELANIGRKPKVVLEIDAVPAIADLVAEGLGHALVTKNAMRVRSRAREFHFRRIVAPALRSTLVIARSAERPLTTLTERTADLLKELSARQLSRN